MIKQKRKSLLTLPFIQLCFSALLFFVSFNMLIPELPSFLTRLGGETHKGLIIALFAVTAGLSRPFSGKMADTVGRVPVMVIGAMVCVICGLLYPLAHTVAAFFALRLLHGFSTGFKPTGTAAYVADLVPANRRGEAMGLVGFFGSLGMALGPLLGSYLAAATSLQVMFYSSSACALLSVGILSNMHETLEHRERFSMDLLRIRTADFYTPRVMPAAVVMVFSVYSFGMVLTIVPDFSDHLGLSNRGLYFACFTVASLLVRVTMGRISDIYGRVPLLLFALFAMALTLFFTGLARTQAEFLFLAFCLGGCVGNVTPTIFAWTIDLAENQRVGRAMATLYIALEVGVGSGALAGGLIFANNVRNIPYAFWSSAASALAAFLYLLFYHLRTISSQRKLLHQI